MILKGKLNQKCKWMVKAGNDSYGDGIFDVYFEIKCRREDEARFVYDKTGRETAVSTTYFVEKQVKPGDLIDEKNVVAVWGLTGLTGKNEGWEVACI